MCSVEQRKIKAVNYCRVSTDDESQILSYEMQKKYKDENYDIVRVFDDQQSGKNIKDRKGFNEMLDYLGLKITYFKDDEYVLEIAKPTDIEVILVSSTSRFARNNVDAQRLLKILHKQGIKVYFQDLKEFSDNPNIDFMLKMYFTFDERYSQDISNKVKNGMDRRKKEGYLLASNRIIGFKLENGILVHDDDAPKVKAMFEDYVNNGLSTRKIAMKYNISLSTVTTLLKNPKYMGYQAYGVKEHRFDYDKLEMHKSEFITPIISEELFWEAQEIRKSRSRTLVVKGEKKNKGINNSTRLLSSKILCPECGKHYHYKNRGYYICGTFSKNKSKCSNNNTVRESWVLDYLKSDFGLKAIRNGIERRLIGALNSLELEDVQPLREQLQEKKAKSQKLLDLYLEEIIDKSTFEDKNSNIKSQIESLEAQLIQISNKEEYKNELERLTFSAKKILNEYEEILASDAPEAIFEKINKITIKRVQDLLTGKTKAIIETVTFKDFKALEEANLYHQYYIHPSEIE